LSQKADAIGVRSPGQRVEKENRSNSDYNGASVNTNNQRGATAMLRGKKQVSRREMLKGAVVVGAGVATAGVFGSLTPPSARAAGIPKKWDRAADVVVIGAGATA
jgi:hypothetical protein